nr:diaminopimelate decarboxylase [Petrotoga sp. 9PWA.NaAc.5.4]
MLPFTEQELLKLISQTKTPFYVYDENGIRQRIKSLKDAFSWANFKEFFAVKATPNPHILKIVKEEGCGVDCSSMAELVLAEQVGFKNEDILFTSNDTPIEEYEKALSLNATLNLDDIGHIEALKQNLKIPELVSIRYNPGGEFGNYIIGNLKESKFGVTKEDLITGFKKLKEYGTKRFGMHIMAVSNELNPQNIVKIAEIMFNLAVELNKNLKIDFDFIDLGGGFGIPYKPGEKELDIYFVASEIKKMYDNIIIKNNINQPKIYMEHGRYITGPNGYLISKVLHIKESYKKYVGIDANSANLLRPAMYKAYHHITVLNKIYSQQETESYDVVGSLCENNDKLAENRILPKLGVGDTLIFHDVGAHGHAMGFNYNGKLRSAEFLFTHERTFKMIRRAETLDDYFATLKI